jgi:MFS family permease
VERTEPMSEAIAVLRANRKARLFFAVLAQSSLGTGAAYVALLVIALDRFDSAWAISLILLADLLPSMLLGPVLGAAADRWSRRRCAIVADLIRAIAFVGIAVVGSFEATLALALLAGVGTALFKPAVLAGLPTLVRGKRLGAATSLYGAITELGFVGGPAIAAPVLLVLGAEDLLVANALTFVVSAAALTRLQLDLPNAVDAALGIRPRPALRAEARAGLRAAAGMPAIRVVIAASAGFMLSGGIFNVVELPFAIDELGIEASGYSILVAVIGLGLIAGSLAGSRGGDAWRLKRRYLAGLVVMGAGGILAGLSSFAPLALAGFALAGFGNGLFVVHERLLFQTQVDPGLRGRVFGISDGVASWGFAAGFLAGGALTELLGARDLILLTGVYEVLLAVVTAAALRGHWRRREEPVFAPIPAAGMEPLAEIRRGEAEALGRR